MAARQAESGSAPVFETAARRYLHRTSRVVLAAAFLGLALSIPALAKPGIPRGPLLFFSALMVAAGLVLIPMATPTVRVTCTPEGIRVRGVPFRSVSIRWEDVVSIRGRRRRPPRVPAFLCVLAHVFKSTRTLNDIGGPRIVVRTNRAEYSISCPDVDGFLAVAGECCPQAVVSPPGRQQRDDEASSPDTGF
ncbi:PH domain-containing protein [Arthrobacter sp. UM1]|uniref:PH domain-containing protein n=1 Tax=Arthrobacter sp. UM1 TaxID=2766776 RepID=UPI001CF63BDE|nr:PH domain-containing protein [Arthrobacter sp. UM1]MCB4207418.1 PH domain-containing protein [Arthrobacter sp. UM1]